MKVRVCPENGSTVYVQELASGRGYTDPVLLEPPPDVCAEGLLLFAGLNQALDEANPGKLLELPPGSTVVVYDEQQQPLVRIEVHRNNSLPMAKTPLEDCFHHIDGESYFTATQFPNPLNPQVSVWAVKNKKD